MKYLLLAVFISANFVVASETKPKYGPEATVLSRSHEYIQHAKAPDYWALSPYYVPQQNGASCSVASVTMVVNAARVGRNLTSDDQLATQSDVLDKAHDDFWKKTVGVSSLGMVAAKGVTLDELKTVALEALKAYGVEADAEVFHADDLSDATRSKLHQALVENEKSARDFIIINFNQGVYTGDSDAGHIAPIGAYDAKNHRVLVMDPDRQWYEPYWVSEETLLKGMATQDKASQRNRGYLWIKLKN